MNFTSGFFYKIEIHQALLSKLLSEQNLSLEMWVLDAKLVSPRWIPPLIYWLTRLRFTQTLLSQLSLLSEFFLKWNGRLWRISPLNSICFRHGTWLNTTQKLIQTFLPFKNLRQFFAKSWWRHNKYPWRHTSARNNHKNGMMKKLWGNKNIVCTSQRQQL